jgi:hypothetical protein
MRFPKARELKTALSLLALVALVGVSTTASAQTTQLSGVKTSVELDPGFVGALVDLGVSPAPIFPATLMGATASFPIPGGVVDTTDLRGDIFHTGGLSLTAGDTMVQLLNFVIDTTGPAELTGAVVVNGSLVDRVALFDLDLSAASVVPGPFNTLEISNVGVTLTAGAAAALNEIFGVGDFFEGLPIGVATVVAQTFGGDDEGNDDEGNDDEDDDEDGDDYQNSAGKGNSPYGGQGNSILRSLANR